MRYFHFLILGPVLIVFGSCSDNEKVREKPPVIVYLAGAEYGLPGYGAVYWKDGKKFPLSDGTNPGPANGEAMDIFVSDDDVYVAGYTYMESGFTQAVYWVNGEMHELEHSTGDARGTGITVSGTDVYVAGHERYNGYSRAIYWKNGVRHTLLATPEDSYGVDIAVLGDDVYLAGASIEQIVDLGNYYAEPYAAYWINENVLRLGEAYSLCTEIVIDGDEVYVLGFDQVETDNGVFTRAVYWHDDERHVLQPLQEGTIVYATGMDVEDGTVHVIGYEAGQNGVASTAIYWKDGMPQEYGKRYSGLAVHDADIYTFGYVNNKVKYFWNDQSYSLEGISPRAHEIAIAPR